MSLSGELHAAPDTFTDGISQFLSECPEEWLDEWEVYERAYVERPWARSRVSEESYRKIQRNFYPSDSVQFAYLPESIEPKTWIVRTNAVTVRHDSGYDREFDVDPDGDRQKGQNEKSWANSGKEPKYWVKGAFVDPIITRSIERVVDHLETQMERIRLATEFNAEIERMDRQEDHWENWDKEPPRELSEYTEQSCPAGHPDGVGQRSIERLADKFGTYYNVTVGEGGEIKNCLSSWHRPPAGPVIDAIDIAINRYQEFRGRDGWDHVDVAPDSWTEYPKEQPI